MSRLLTTVREVGGVTPTSVILDRGFSRHQIDRAVSAGVLHRLRRGWVALPDAAADISAAVAAGGVLSCISLLARQQIWSRTDERLHVAVHRHAHLAQPAISAKAILHRSPTGSPGGHGGMDSLAAAVAHATVCQPRLDAIATLDSVLNQRILSPRELTAALDHLPRCYRAYLRHTEGSSQSGLESKARIRLRALGCAIRPQVWIDGVGRVDLLLGDRLVIELDGRRWHDDADSFENDRRRDLALAQRDFRCIRLSARQVQEQWPTVEHAIRALIARGEHRWPRRSIGRLPRTFPPPHALADTMPLTGGWGWESARAAWV